MAAIGSPPFERGDNKEGFLIVTTAADNGLIDIHDRRPLVLSSEAASDWMQPDVSSDEAEVIARECASPADEFAWYAVTPAVGNVRNQGYELLKPLTLE
ncbi:putative SOS response-associated peptidase YedK [compost metagenome]